MQVIKSRTYDFEKMVPLLQNVAIEPTNHCNLSCPICWSQNPHLHPPRERGFMDMTLYRKIIDELAAYVDMVKRRILLCLNYGGESLLHPRFDEMLSYAASKRAFKLQLITNGLLLDRHIPLLSKIGVLVTISYHRLPPEQTETLHRNIGMLVARRGYTRLNMAVVDAESPGLFQEAKDRYGSLVYNYPLISEDLKYLEGSRKDEEYCKSPFHYMAVLWNGDVWPCCHLLSSDFPSLGNLNNGSILDVWEGDEYERLRGAPEEFPCKDCQLW